MKSKHMLHLSCLLAVLLLLVTGSACAEEAVLPEYSLAAEWTERHEALVSLASQLASLPVTICETADSEEEAGEEIDSLLLETAWGAENVKAVRGELDVLLPLLTLPAQDPDAAPPALFALLTGNPPNSSLLIGRTDHAAHASGLLIQKTEDGQLRLAAQISIAPDSITLTDRPGSALLWPGESILPIAEDESSLIVLNAQTGVLTGSYTLAPGPSDGENLVILAGAHPLPDGYELGVSEAHMLHVVPMSIGKGMSADMVTGMIGDVYLQYINQSILLPGSAPAADEAALPLTLDISAEWASSNTSVIRVDDDGLLTAVGTGKATITALSGERTASITLSVHPAICPLCGSDIGNLTDMPAHHAAICGVEGHCAAVGTHSAEPISRFCSAEPQHTVCEGDPEHICSGEYGCGETYLCSDSNEHAICIRCGKPWCWEGDEDHPVSHLNLECGYHRACEIPESEYDEHLALPCGHASCDYGPDFSHEKLPCGEHYVCRIADSEEAGHQLLSCGHAACDGQNHSLLPCGKHLACEAGAEGASGHELLSCGHAACDPAYSDHSALPCGKHLACEAGAEGASGHQLLSCGHAACDGQNHSLLPCGEHLACAVPEAEQSNHALLGCGHAACASDASAHRRLACERHYACGIPADELTSHGLLFCGHATCESYDGAEHKLLPCGEHLDCMIDADKRGGHVMLSCGHTACSIEPGSSHNRGACGIHFVCQGGNHAVCPGCAQFFCSEGDHVPMACGHYACMPDLGLTHEQCGLCGGWLCGSEQHGTGACNNPEPDDEGEPSGLTDPEPAPDEGQTEPEEE